MHISLDIAGFRYCVFFKVLVKDWMGLVRFGLGFISAGVLCWILKKRQHQLNLSSAEDKFWVLMNVLSAITSN